MQHYIPFVSQAILHTHTHTHKYMYMYMYSLFASCCVQKHMLWTFVSKDFVMCSGLHPSMCAVHVRLSRDLNYLKLHI